MSHSRAYYVTRSIVRAIVWTGIAGIWAIGFWAVFVAAWALDAN